MFICICGPAAVRARAVRSGPHCVPSSCARRAWERQPNPQSTPEASEGGRRALPVQLPSSLFDSRVVELAPLLFELASCVAAAVSFAVEYLTFLFLLFASTTSFCLAACPIASMSASAFTPSV